MAKRGRKRKEGVKRDSRGRSRGETKDAIRAVAMAQPHRAWLAGAYVVGREDDPRLNPMAESPLGLLRLSGEITGPQYAAGNILAEIVARYRAAIGSRDPEQQNHSTGRGLEISETEYRARKKRYDDAYESMHGLSGVQKEVSRVAVNEKPASDLKKLVCGLQCLALHFGLTKAAKSAPCRNSLITTAPIKSNGGAVVTS